MSETESINVRSNCYEGLCSLFTIIGSKTDPDFGDKDAKSEKNEDFNKTFWEMINEFKTVKDQVVETWTKIIIKNFLENW